MLYNHFLYASGANCLSFHFCLQRLVVVLVETCCCCRDLELLKRLVFIILGIFIRVTSVAFSEHHYVPDLAPGVHIQLLPRSSRRSPALPSASSSVGSSCVPYVGIISSVALSAATLDDTSQHFCWHHLRCRPLDGQLQ